MSEEEAATEATADSGETTGTLEGDAATVASEISTTTETKTEATGEAATPSEWFYAKDVPGTGDKPDFMLDKYENLSEQAKAYNELQSKFGSFTGSPESYEVAIDDELKEQGFELDKDDPLIESAFEMAKDMNMSQDGFNKMMNMYGMVRVAEQTALEEYKATEMKALGPTANTRVQNLDSWAKSKLPADLYEGFQDLAHSASSVQALERLVAMTRSAPMTPEGEGSPTAAISQTELHAMQFAKDEYGGRKINSDPDYRRRYEQLRDQYYGTEEHRVIVNKI